MQIRYRKACDTQNFVSRTVICISHSLMLLWKGITARFIALHSGTMAVVVSDRNTYVGHHRDMRMTITSCVSYATVFVILHAMKYRCNDVSLSANPRDAVRGLLTFIMQGAMRTEIFICLFIASKVTLD